MHSQRWVASEVGEFFSAPPAHHGARRRRGGCRAGAPPCAPQNRNQWSTRSRGILETTAPTNFAKILGNLLKPGHDLVQVISQEGTHCVQHAFDLIC